MKKISLSLLLILMFHPNHAFGQTFPTEIQFSRQASRRLVFDRSQEILLWSLDPKTVVGPDVMHPSTTLDDTTPARYSVKSGLLHVHADNASRSAMWLGGLNPFAGHVLQIQSLIGNGMTGFDWSSPDAAWRLSILLAFKEGKASSTIYTIKHNGQDVLKKTLHDFNDNEIEAPFEFRIQMLGVGATVFLVKDTVPMIAGQIDHINYHVDLRRKEAMSSWHTRLLTDLQKDSENVVSQARASIDTGVGLADMRAITWRDGRPYLQNNRVFYTMSIRGRTLPQHIQGVFSMNPSVFDLKLEGIILFDLNDGLLRNEIASHIFYDDQANEWRGVTTGFSAFADPHKREKKEILAVRSQKDPRFGISIMAATPMGLVGNYEDPHVIYDKDAGKWRMLLCEQHDGFKAVIRESVQWNGGYEILSGPVDVDSTGTMIQKIKDQRYCLFGSNTRQLYIYSYPHLKFVGPVKMDLPPWSDTSGTRVWANLIPLPPGYLSRYVLLTMDRLNYPNIKGANWSYGALYLYHGRHPAGSDYPYEYDLD